MSAGKPWTFTQVAGDRKVLTLAGESAPHGRPRASPVVEDEMGLRDATVYSPGNPRPARGPTKAEQERIAREQSWEKAVSGKSPSCCARSNTAPTSWCIR